MLILRWGIVTAGTAIWNVRILCEGDTGLRRVDRDHAVVDR
jgi:hypothetical protein